MATNSMNAADNAALANDLIDKAINTEEIVEPAKLTSPSDVLVTLPGGYVVPTGEVISTAEVRELNGRDEEIIVKSSGNQRVFAAILNRGTVKLGSLDATEPLLDDLLIGDRDELLLGIYRATFGETAELGVWCEGCKETKIVGVDVRSDIKRKVLTDPVNDRVFMVKGKKNEYTVTLPTGITQKKMLVNPDINQAEALTLLLEQTVLEINGQPVVSKMQVQTLPISDRHAIADEIAIRNPGPQFEDATVTCPDCESEVQVPINLGAMFRF
jgi:hypothetical protein